MYTTKLAPPPVTSANGHFVHPVQPLNSSGATKELLWFTNGQLDVVNNLVGPALINEEVWLYREILVKTWRITM